MILVFERGQDDFRTMGLGEIRPVSCVVHEEQGGAYELELECPMDDQYQYDLLVSGRMVRVPVPTRTTPHIFMQATQGYEVWKTTAPAALYVLPTTEMGYSETYYTQETLDVALGRTPDSIDRTKYDAKKAKPKKVEKGRSDQTSGGTDYLPPRASVDRDQKVSTKPPKPTPQPGTKTVFTPRTRWISNGNRILEEIAAGQRVILLGAPDAGWQHLVSPGGATGYVQSSLLELVQTVPGTPEETIQPRQVREQLFRIYRVEKDTQRLSVKAWARHVYYDLVGNALLECKAENVLMQQAFAMQNAASTQPGHGYKFYTNETAKLVSGDWSRRNLVEAQLDPDDGLLMLSNTRLVRDNYEVFFLQRSETARHPVSYAQNLMGVTVEINEETVVNRIVPVGKSKDGSPVYIDSKYLDSPRNGPETILKAQVIEYSEAAEKDARDDEPGMTIDQVKAKLAELAAADFEAGIDYPDISVTVDFLQLGDTEEYQQYKHLDRLYLGDIVQIYDEIHGIDVEAEVTEYDYDCLMGRYTSMVVGVTSAMRTIGSVTSYMLPGGSIRGYKLAMNSVDGSRIAYMSIGAAKIGLAAIQAAHIEYGAIKRAHIEEAAIGSAQIEEASISGAHIKDATIEDAKIGTAGIDFSRIRDLAADTAVITEGMGGKLIIDRLAVSEANIVHLTAGQLIVQGASGALYQLTVNEDGDVITELRQIGNNDIADVSLNAGEKLIKSSITADLLDVQEIFASQAMIAAIKAHNIETHSIGADQLVPGIFEEAARNATGQQLVIEWSQGTILDRENTQTIGTLRMYHQGVEITDRIPDNAIHWQRISDDPAADAAWNADPAHQGTKTITITASDVDFRGVIRCGVDEVRLHAVPDYVDGTLYMTDWGSGDGANFWLDEEGVLWYEGPNHYTMSEEGTLYVDMMIGAFRLDTQLQNLKTAYMDISRHGIELYADGYFNIRGGSGANAFGLSTDHAMGYLMWAGHPDPDNAPFAVMRDGTMRNGANIFTMTFEDEADGSHPFRLKFALPGDLVAIDKVLLTYWFEPFRATSRGAAHGGGGVETSSSGGGSAPTSRSGGGGTSGPTTATTEQWGGNTGAAVTSGTTHFHIVPQHTHNMSSHTHSVPAHTHIVDIPDHTHSVTIPAHAHDLIYGIYEAGKATACRLEVDGSTVYASVGERINLDISPWLTKSGAKITRDAQHTVVLTPNALTRVKAQIMVKGAIVTRTIGIY